MPQWMAAATHGSLFGAAVAALFLTGCAKDGTDSGDWKGTVYDSAGISVVQNPSDGIWTPRTAWRLEEDLRIGAVDGDSVRQFSRISGTRSMQPGESTSWIGWQAKSAYLIRPDSSFGVSAGLVKGRAN